MVVDVSDLTSQIEELAELYGVHKRFFLGMNQGALDLAWLAARVHGLVKEATCLQSQPPR